MSRTARLFIWKQHSVIRHCRFSLSNYIWLHFGNKRNITLCRLCTSFTFSPAKRVRFLLQDSRELKANTTLTEARTPSEKLTSRFWNHFLIIQSRYAWEMCSNYPGIKLEQALRDKKTKLNNCRHMLTSFTPLQNKM